MRRKLWTAVLVTVVLMVAAGNLPGRVPSSWLVAGSALWDGIIRHLPVSWERVLVAGSSLRAAWIASLPALLRVLQVPAVAVGGVAILAALAGALFTLALACRRRDPFQFVVREVRRGRDIASVARRARLAQDAVRTLLQPGRTERRRSRRRREEPSVPEGLTPRIGRGRTTAAGGMRWVESS